MGGFFRALLDKMLDKMLKRVHHDYLHDYQHHVNAERVSFGHAERVSASIKGKKTLKDFFSGFIYWIHGDTLLESFKIIKFI